ncbi:MAG: hypothetical protein DBW89_01550 [Halieaceae bacterium]|nr:MAG: hypothetical protein DBW89_01550 [Halieaceae bacterium]
MLFDKVITFDVTHVCVFLMFDSLLFTMWEAKRAFHHKAGVLTCIFLQIGPKFCLQRASQQKKYWGSKIDQARHSNEN